MQYVHPIITALYFVHTLYMQYLHPIITNLRTAKEQMLMWPTSKRNCRNTNEQVYTEFKESFKQNKFPFSGTAVTLKVKSSNYKEYTDLNTHYHYLKFTCLHTV